MTINPDKNHRILVIDDNRAIHEDFGKALVKTSNQDAGFDEATASLFGEAPAQSEELDSSIDSALSRAGGAGID